MKKSKRTLLSLNKTRIYSLNHLSRIIGGLNDKSNGCETYDKDICICEETSSCQSSAYAPPTGGDKTLVISGPTQTNGLPGNDCC